LSFETGSLYVSQTGLELMNLLPVSPGCLDYGPVPPHPALSSNLK
jgi:hypothetical protein